MTLQYGRLRIQWASPVVSLAVGLLLAIVLALLSGRWSGSLRSVAATLLRPGQKAASSLHRQGGHAIARVKRHFKTTGRLAEAEHELKRLKQENRRLAAELDAMRSRPDAAPPEGSEDEAERLLRARCVTARILGRQARAFLGRHHILDVGSGARIEPDALVVDAAALIDRGDDANMRPGQLVLSGRRVWGKIVEVGRNTSTVRALTEPGYRDVVQLGKRRGPQGILEGTGRPLPRIRMVEVTEPVSVGDPVYTATGKGVLSEPPLYGRIVRLERPVGAAHWEIWMQPAVPDRPERVAVLRMELNPVRMAEKGRGTRDEGQGARE